MIRSLHNKQSSVIYKILCSFVALTFSSSVILPPAPVFAQTVLNLPVPGTMVAPSPGFMPVLMTGLTIHPDNPLRFDFIMDTGHSGLDINSEEFKQESAKLIKYFMASLTTPEEELWVNLSPYEKDRMIPLDLGKTEMGRDMLAQDYLLKQLTASLMYPEQELGKEFWDRVYKKAYEKFGTTEIPLNTFNKIWIVPEDALVYEQDGSAFVIHSKLAVMLEEDYEALRQSKNTAELASQDTVVSGLQSQVVREVLIPEITKEINEGKNFANLRQIFNALILATWYKVRLKESLLGKVYVNQGKTKGISSQDEQINEKIYAQYLDAFKRGVYNYIREDYDGATQQIIPRKYFSGGVSATTMPNGTRLSRFLRTTGLVLGLTAFSALPLSAQAKGKDVLEGVGKQAGVTAEFVENSPNDVIVTVRNGKNVRPVLLAQGAKDKEKLKGPGSSPVEQTVYTPEEFWGLIEQIADTKTFFIDLKPANSIGLTRITMSDIHTWRRGEGFREIVGKYNGHYWRVPLSEIVQIAETQWHSLESFSAVAGDYIKRGDELRVYKRGEPNRVDGRFEEIKGKRLWLTGLNGVKISIAEDQIMIINAASSPVTDKIATVGGERYESTLNLPDATVWFEGAAVDSAGVKFEGDVYIYNHTGQPVNLSEQAGRFFPKTPEGKPLVKDTVLVIKPSADAAVAASPIVSSPVGRKLTSVVLALAAAGMICLSGCGGPGSKTPEPPPPITKDFDVNSAVTWMSDQINPKTNLIRSFQNLPAGDPSNGVTWIYNQAQAIEGFLAAGEVAKAERLADGLLALQGADGAWYNAYVTDKGSVATNLFEQYTRWVGPNVVVGRALVDVSESTGDGKYTAAAMKLTGWLDKYFVDRGSYGYLTGGVGVPWTSTEHNMRAMAFYDRVGDKPRADLIAAFLNNKMYNPREKRYYVGYSSGEIVNTDPTMATDVQYLGPLMAQHGGRDPQAFAGGIDWLLEHQTAIVLDNQGLVGIPRWLNVGNSLWFEGIGELAGALQVLGREEEIDKFLSSIKAVQRSDGSLPAAIGGTSGWPGNFSYSSVEAVGSDVAAVLGDPRHMARPLVSEEQDHGASSQRPGTTSDEGRMTRDENASSPVAKVLIVDDNSNLLSDRKTILERNGHTVTTANDGAEAFQVFQESSFDLVLTDYEMPNLDGPGLISKIRAYEKEQSRQISMPIIMVSADITDEKEEKAQELGVPLYSKVLGKGELRNISATVEEALKQVLSSPVEEAVDRLIQTLKLLNDQFHQGLEQLHSDSSIERINKLSALADQMGSALKGFNPPGEQDNDIAGHIRDVLGNRLQGIMLQDIMMGAVDVRLKEKEQSYVADLKEGFQNYQREFGNLELIVERGELKNIKSYWTFGHFVNLDKLPPASSPVGGEDEKWERARADINDLDYIMGQAASYYDFWQNPRDNFMSVRQEDIDMSRSRFEDFDKRVKAVIEVLQVEGDADLIKEILSEMAITLGRGGDSAVYGKAGTQKYIEYQRRIQQVLMHKEGRENELLISMLSEAVDRIADVHSRYVAPELQDQFLLDPLIIEIGERDEFSAFPWEFIDRENLKIDLGFLGILNNTRPDEITPTATRSLFEIVAVEVEKARYSARDGDNKGFLGIANSWEYGSSEFNQLVEMWRMQRSNGGATASSPMIGHVEPAPGGIDFNPALLDLQIKRDGNGVPLPLPQQPIENMHIDGFVPIIINVTPISNLPMLLGLADTGPDTKESSPVQSRRDFYGERPAFKTREVEPVSLLN